MTKTMKRAKYLLAFLAAAVFAFALAVPAFAADGDQLATAEDTISATELADGSTVQYYQLVEWKDGDWALTTLGTAAGVSLENLVDGISEAEATTIATALAAAEATGTMTVSGTTATATPVAAGLYYLKAIPGDNDKDTVYNPAFVSADYKEGGNSIAFTSTIGDSAVLKKSTVPFDKDVDSTDKYVDTKPGDVIPYKITTTIPSYGTSFENPTFTITDTLSAGLTLEGDVTVKYGEATTTESVENVVTITKGTPDNGFTVKFEKDYLNGLAGATPDIEITYSAKVTTEALDNVTYMDNRAHLEFSNTPNTTQSKDDITRHYTFSIDGNLLGGSSELTKELIKTGTDAEGNPISEEVTYYNEKEAAPLDGAEFTLYAADGTTVIATTNSANGGYLTFNGLDAGTYILKETKAPAGYVGDSRTFTVTITPKYADNPADLLESYEITITSPAVGDTPAYSGGATFTMNNEGGVTESSLPGTDTSFINNTQGAELPSTGGIGTTIFYIVGGIMVVGAAIFLITRRRAAKAVKTELRSDDIL